MRLSPSDMPRVTRPHRLATILTASVVWVIGIAQVQAAGVIYRCESASGVIEYSNSAPAGSKACKKISLPTITTIPAPKPVKTAVQNNRNARSGGDEAFPKVPPARQRKRDSDRARILRDELSREESKLADLKKTYNNGEPERLGNERNYQKYLDRVARMKSDIARSEGNIKALRRELSALRP